MVTPKLRRRGSWFGVTDAIRSVLSDIELNVADVIDQIGRWGKPRWRHIETSSTTIQLSPWDYLVCDAACAVVIPAPTPDLYGCEVCITNSYGGIVSVTAVSGTIDGLTIDYVSGTRVYICTRAGWRFINDFEDSWDDVIGPVDFAASVGALTQETYIDTPVTVSSFRHDQDDAMTLRYQMPHGWDRGVVKPHLHYIPLANGNGDMVLNGYYAWSHMGTLALPSLSGWTSFSVTESIVAADRWIEQVVSLASCSPPSAAQYPSANLWLYVRRYGSSASDTYTTNKTGGVIQANVAIAAVDCHVRRSRSGTTQEWY